MKCKPARRSQPSIPAMRPMRRGRAQLAAAAAVLLLVSLAGAGCGAKTRGTPVTFVAEPGPAVLRVERLPSPQAARGQIIAQGASPLSARLDLAAPANWRVTAEPASAEAREAYRTTEATYDRQGLIDVAGSEPNGPTNLPLRVVVGMRPQESAPMPALVPVYHPRFGWLALRTRLRAYRNLVEADGTAPEHVAALSGLSGVGSPERLGDVVGVWGLDVSDVDGGRIVTSVFRPAEQGLDLESEDPEAAPLLARIERPEDRRRARFRSASRFPIQSADLVSLRLTGLTEVRVTGDGHVDVTPAFSPDGQFVFFASTRDQRGSSDIFRRPSLRAGALDVVTRNLPEGGAAWPSQATDGDIAFGFFPAAATTPDAGHIYAKIGGLGGYDSLIVQGGSDPRISPDGQLLAYISRGDLWVCSVDGSQQRRLTTDGAALLEEFGQHSLASADDERRFEQFERQWLFAPYRDPAWSPDSRQVVYSSLAGPDAEGRPNYNIWLLDLDSGRGIQITTNGSADVLPRFDASGQFIYFMSNRGRQWAIWRLPAPQLSAPSP